MATKMIDELKVAYISFSYTAIMVLDPKKSQGGKFGLGNGC